MQQQPSRCAIRQKGGGAVLCAYAHERLWRGRVHEVKVDEVVDPELLELQHDRAQVGAQDLRVAKGAGGGGGREREGIQRKGVGGRG